MSFNAPNPPDPATVSDSQLAYNKIAAKAQNQNNSYNQQTPFGTLTYVTDPNSPSGYTLETSLSPAQQGLLDTRVGTQQTLGTAGNQLATNAASMYSTPFDLNAATGKTADLLNSWRQQYVQPIFNQQSSNLEAQLRNQGLTPGSEAYNNAKNLLARNQGDVTNQYLTENEGQAFNQAVQNYQLPLQTIAGLFGSSAPQSPAFQSTPTAQVQPPNFTQAAQNQYAGQYQNYQNTIGGLGQIAGLAGGMIAAPFTGGASLFAGGPMSLSPGMFGGGWGAGAGTIGGTGGMLGGLY